jgi:hypothetical protein
MAKYEWELSALEGMGLSDVDLDSALTHILVVVASLAQANANQLAVEQVSALTDQDWWSDKAPFLALAFDHEKYPLAERVGTAAGEALEGGYRPEHAWKFAIDRLLDGMQTMTRAR